LRSITHVSGFFARELELSNFDYIHRTPDCFREPASNLRFIFASGRTSSKRDP
jgi:hypothetical protein